VRRVPTIRTARRLLAAGIAVACLVLGVVGLAGADAGQLRTRTVVGGVPLETVAPAGATAAGVVVAHGFAGSIALMRGFADTLARRGITVVLLDFAGHGASTRPFDRAVLDADLQVAVAHLRSLPGIDPARVALLGHSMGAGAVLRRAAADPRIAATVAISAGGGDAAGVRNLLVLAGSLEFAGIRRAGPLLTGLDTPDTTVGDLADGTARRYAEIPGTEHVAVLFAATTHRAVTDWLDGALGSGPAGPLLPLNRAGPALLLHLAALLGFGAVAATLRPGAATERPPLGPLRTAAAPLLAAVAAVTVMLLVPRGWLPVEVADYAIGFIGVLGLGLLASGLGTRSPAPAPRPGRAGRIAPTLLMTAFAVAGFAVPAHLGWANSVPSGVRWWLLLPAFTAAALLVAGLEVLARDRTPGPAVLVHAWGSVVVVVGLAVAVLAGAPPFVLFVVPLFAALLAWQGVLAAALRARHAPLWTISAVGGALLAWPLALTFPVTVGG
jgi:dienelactone hydrolase